MLEVPISIILFCAQREENNRKKISVKRNLKEKFLEVLV